MILKFEKYQGLGNDFIFIDQSWLQDTFQSGDIQKMCDRHQGIGADGLIVVDTSHNIEFQVYNSDGSWAEMCGNALRCLFLFLKKKWPEQNVFEVYSKYKMHTLSQKGDEIECTMGDVQSIEWGIDLDLKACVYQGHFLNTGVPHLIIPVQDLHHLPILPLGSSLRNHPKFQPEGTNVNFISINTNQEVEVRTYERGVENETQACGTGCAAAAIVAKALFNLKNSIAVKPIFGELLHFDFQFNKNQTQVYSLCMRGKAQFVFEGSIELANIRKNVVLSVSNL